MFPFYQYFKYNYFKSLTWLFHVYFKMIRGKWVKIFTFQLLIFYSITFCGIEALGYTCVCMELPTEKVYSSYNPSVCNCKNSENTVQGVSFLMNEVHFKIKHFLRYNYFFYQQMKIYSNTNLLQRNSHSKYLWFMVGNQKHS